MAHHDLREYLEALEAGGEFRRHDAPIDSRLEVGAVAQHIAEKGGPAVQFTNAGAGPAGASLVCGTMNRGTRGIWTKLAHALELDPEIKHPDLLEEVVKRVDAVVKPMQVKTGPCKENILRDDEVDLEQVVAPWIHGDDGGRCISSWAATVVQEPGSNYVAWEVIPHLVAGPRELVARVVDDGAVGRIIARHRTAGSSMPFAIVLGGPPIVQLAAAFRRVRSGITGPDLAGSLQRSPLQMVKCETSTLLVPATAEMVIEGVVNPGRTAPTLSFPGSFGFRNPEQRSGRVFEVTAITYRNRPILPFATWGVPITELHLARSLDGDAQIKQEFTRRGTPARHVYTPPWLAGSVMAVSTRVPYTAFSQAVAGMIRTNEATKNTPYIMVCDDDIDITNPVSLFHALVTKCKPGRDTWQVHVTRAADDAPYLDPADRAAGRGSSIILDCTWPLDWDRSIAVPPRVSFDQCYPKALQEKVLATWSTELGFPREADRPAGMT